MSVDVDYVVDEYLQAVMHSLVEGGADVTAEDEEGLSALLNAVKVGLLLV